ncbi:hypothetical protein LG329_15895 [Virgibacillus necropolis]|uniref:hypothetical protein n=1 Tax=Virgibacillus necropolis TaxID=163877 RepID=UPI0038517D9A
MRLISGIIIILILVSGCSSKPSLELISSSAEIRDDRSGGIGITSGEREGQIIKPISLSYNFVIKNTGKDTIGGTEELNSLTFEYEDGIKLSIEPNEKLKAVTKEVVGFKIYKEGGRQQANLGVGKTSIPVLQPNQDGEYTIDFVLGALEENPEIRLAPSQAQLDKLEKNAMEATLVIYSGDKEIARIDLHN